MVLIPDGGEVNMTDAQKMNRHQRRMLAKANRVKKIPGSNVPADNEYDAG